MARGSGDSASVSASPPRIPNIVSRDRFLAIYRTEDMGSMIGILLQGRLGAIAIFLSIWRHNP